MRNLTTFLLGLLVSLFLVAPVFAQTHQASGPAEIAKKYNVTFPIAELGGCTDFDSCRNFCEDPVNSSSCVSFAKQKGFYQEDKFEVKDNVLQAAKSQLGCDSYASCLNFCEVPANFDKCDSFAKTQGLVGGRVEDPSKTQILTQAKQVLGCDSATGCQSYCSKEENRQKCSDFAKTVGLHGGEHQVGPGGCTSEATCKSFCSDPQNFQICSGFSSTSGGTFTGPGGCNSEASCRTYCQQNEDQCRGSFAGPGGSPPPGYNPQEMCNRTPNCSWTGNTCQCGFYGETQESAQKAGEYAAFCQANPDKCKPGQPAGFGSDQQRQEFENYCRQNPDKCKPPNTNISPSSSPPPSGGTYSPAPAPTPTGTNYPTATSQPSSYDPATECVKYPGCSWTNNSCQCSSSAGSTSTPQPTSTTTQPAPTESTPTPAPTTTTTTSCPEGSYMKDGACVQGVLGVSTVRGILQQLLDLLGF